ncbi:MAG: M14 family zinc carboxypeptidase [Deltaproteobacteria bacterium]
MRRALFFFFVVFFLAVPASAAEQRIVELSLPTQADFDSAIEVGARPLACRAGPGTGAWLIDGNAGRALDAAGLGPRSLLGNLAALLRDEQKRRGRSVSASENFYADYREWTEIETRLDALAAAWPARASLVDLGQSFEGREIRALKISGTAAGSRPTLLLNGAQHAREWIAAMVPVYIAEQLLERSGSDATVAALLDAIDVWVVPVVNPDGYVHSHAAGGDRMWRKNRRLHSGSSCFGVDLNRNWGTDWNGGQSTIGNRCSDVYTGTSAHSEPETQALQALVESLPNLVGHVDFHNYSQVILQPWGYTNTLPVAFAEIDALGAAMGAAMEAVHGESYPNASGDGGLYLASGIFPDWTTAVHGALGYTIELRPTSAFPGFLLPADEIVPTGEEALAGVFEMMRWAVAGCGDGVLDTGEECDDANLDDGDGCNATCQRECDELAGARGVFARLDRIAGEQKFSLKADFQGAPAGFVPATHGIEIRILDSAGDAVASWELPGGAWDSVLRRGWRENRGGTKSIWRDRAAGALSRAVFTTRSGGFRVSLGAKQAALAGSGGPLRVQLRNVTEGVCAETSWSSSQCALVRNGATLRCR